MGTLPRVVLHKGRERSVLGRHPWVFSGAIQRVIGSAEEGSIVEIVSADKELLGIGHFSPQNSIAVKLISFKPEPITPAFWRTKLLGCLEYRRSIGLIGDDQTNAFRLVHAEGDGLPGLIIDVYGETAVLQYHSQGMQRAESDILAALLDLPALKISTVFNKSIDTLAGEEARNSFLLGEQTEGSIVEGGLRFHVQWESGQKTGFFLDQRENRRTVRMLARDKKVLNTFSYTGGFSVNALAGGAAHVTSVDSSRPAMELLERNVLANGIGKGHLGVQGDCFEYLSESKESFDLIILDPPAFAKRKKDVAAALKGYRRLNQLAFRRLNEKGVLVTFSCSQLVSREDFRFAVMGAALDIQRSVRVLKELHQAPCHPVSLFHPEGDYLKGFVVYVE